ncbi:MAG: 2-oxoglutarate dehydrogenase complex dihydrolipoyllysine-residue succinyltransferase [Cyclobacteriaceae bacterium]|nr:2-oxoglutarate dehydrogenase complex dihydrolipoyllysine-residue succinyltransferase [Cyclobacteriaceae bacterium]
MPLEIKIPQVGESITEVTIAVWLKKDGDFVEMDEVICELESEKATFELNAEAAGILRIKAQEGDAIAIGATVCVIEERASAPAESKTETIVPQTAAPKPTGETIEMRVPEVGESITEVTMAAWIKNEGDFVELDEIIAEIDSDKATFELPAEGSGILHQSCAEGDTLQIGDLICTIALSDAAPTTTATPKVAPAQAATSGNTTYASGHASPAAAKILAEKGIDAASVKGTGVDGRITKEDAEKARLTDGQAQKQVPKAAAPVASKTEVATAPVGERNETRKKMSSLRKTVARRLVAVKNDTAMLTTFNEVNMKPIMDLRKKYKEQFKEKHEIGLGFMSFFTKACTMALLEWPSVNGQIDGEEIVHFDYCDISIAVSAPKGLVVPVIRNAEKLSFAGIESEVRRLALKARDGKLSIPEMTGGTFTLTNGGVFGSMMSTPIINSPQSAILGMHNIVERAVVENGEIVVRPMMYLALSYDHRIIDGRESVSFLVRLKELLEDPTRLLLEV